MQPAKQPRLFFCFLIGIMFSFSSLMASDTPIRAAESDTYTYHFPIIMNNGRPCTEPNPAKGVAWAHFGKQQPQDHKILCISWYHVWAIHDTMPKIEGVELIQHFWCDIYPSNATTYHEIEIDYKERAWQMLGPDFDGYLLFLNEPDLPVPQCNRSPKIGAELYVWLKKNLPQAKLIGPQVSHRDSLNGWTWLLEWRQQVISMTGSPPEMYAYTIHDYVFAHPPSIMVDSLYQLMETWGDEDKPIWVTEYGALTSEKMAEMTEFYAHDPRIARFAGYSPYLIDNDSPLRFFDWHTKELTPVGSAFALNGN